MARPIAGIGYVFHHTEAAIAVGDSHAPDASANAGRCMRTSVPKKVDSAWRSASVISWKRDGTSAGFDSDGT